MLVSYVEYIFTFYYHMEPAQILFMYKVAL